MDPFAEDVKVALAKNIGGLPELLRLTLTWDRGRPPLDSGAESAGRKYREL